MKILGINGSYRKGKTTSEALRVCLEAAAAAGAETELIELADYAVPGEPSAGLPVPPGQKDDFPKLAGKLSDPRMAGIIVGSPVYFYTMTPLCKAFLDRCAVFRKDFGLADTVGGARAVGGARNGGQEMTLVAIQAAMMCQEMIVVGDGRPTAHIGATLVNDGKDSIAGDAYGIATAQNLGRRVAEVALRLARR